MVDRLLTPADVAERCQISTKTVLRAIPRGRLQASRLGEHGEHSSALGIMIGNVAPPALTIAIVTALIEQDLV